MSECERVETEYLSLWGPLSDAELLAYEMEIEEQLDRKRTTDLEHENETGMYSYSH